MPWCTARTWGALARAGDPTPSPTVCGARSLSRRPARHGAGRAGDPEGEMTARQAVWGAPCPCRSRSPSHGTCRVVLAEMVQPGLLGVNSIEEATIGRPALDVEELGHSEVEAIVRGRAGEVLREVPRALD